ncbi:OmpA family protein [Maritimibacter dapengensis]|uniref:OmpA family protein n=1 Tax=Maritimibacter dapengensis TaxID=2836868 RepID=A0ABS6T3Q7_9RHOB|nr:OmpA family protein [Maritimibacter dapengensis]MBV7378977.1 OmpA family protein [Maritimibacter dapengensis]
MSLKLTARLIAATSVVALLAGCDAATLAKLEGREAGAIPADRGFGSSTQHNHLLQTGQISYVESLAARFNETVPDTINFAFNSAQIDEQARQILARQAHFIRQFPEVRFRVYGHTDKVGSAGYNKSLGLRRAQAVVHYFASQGISTSRLEAVVSYGETQPLVQTQDRERRNRRTVTEVSGFVQSNPLILNGKYAEVVFREYVNTAQSDNTVQGGLAELLAAAGGG